MTNGKYRGGQFAGMTQGEVERYAQQQWSALSYEQQMAYEKDAAMFGASKAQAPQSPNQQHTGEVLNSDGTTSFIITQ